MKKRSDGRYQKRITLPNGKSKLLYSSANTEREAIKDFNRQMLAMEEEKQKSSTFESVANKWASEHFPTLALNTLKSYKVSLKQAIEYFSDTPINEIEADDVSKYVNSLKNKNYAKKTIKERLAVLKKIFKYAHIKSSPCQFIVVPKDAKPSKKREAATAEEETIIKNLPDDMPFGYLAKFILYTGCRRGEALALSPADIDYDNKTVRVDKTVVWQGNFPQIKPSPKTEAGERFIPLLDFLMPELEKRRKNKYIFQNEIGKLLKDHEYEKQWKDLKKTASINCTAHQLRHSYTTMLFDAGIDVKTAQTWLGHKDIKTTLDIYTHLSKSRLDQSIKKWSDFVNDKR